MSPSFDSTINFAFFLMPAIIQSSLTLGDREGVGEGWGGGGWGLEWRRERERGGRRRRKAETTPTQQPPKAVLILLLVLPFCCLATWHHSSPACDWSAVSLSCLPTIPCWRKQAGIPCSSHRPWLRVKGVWFVWESMSDTSLVGSGSFFHLLIAKVLEMWHNNRQFHKCDYLKGMVRLWPCACDETHNVKTSLWR